MRPLIVAANWKMHTAPSDAAALAAAIAAASDQPDVVRVICPPFLSLAPVRDAIAGTGIEIGAQDVHHEVAGAYTGETSAPMLAGLATWVILGHSERRRDAGETDALVNRKLARALDSGLRPILCVGELLADRDAGRAEEVVSAQVRACLAGLDPDALAAGGLVVAYEPVWAIGTGRTARGADAAAMADAIRRVVAEVASPTVAEGLPVLYGGSVTAANVAEFLGEPSVDGALVGGASLKPDEMAGIVSRAAVTAAARAAASAG
jgi:triosephosphate isomerase (TIM)